LRKIKRKQAKSAPVKFGDASSEKDTKQRKPAMNSELSVSIDNIKSWIETGMKSMSTIEDDQGIELPWELPFITIKVIKEEATVH